MTTYSTWAYYSNEYHGRLPEAEYIRHAPDAKYQIDWLTRGQAATAPHSMADQLTRCECKMLDAAQTAESLGIAAGVTSVNNDGYSVGFDAKAMAEVQNELKNIALQHLTYPVNLMFGGAVIRNVCG